MRPDGVGTVRLSVVLTLALAVGVVTHAAGTPGDRVKGFFDRHRREARIAGSARLAAAGKARFDIVVPAQAPPALRFAGEELKRYLDRITGAAFRIVEKPGAVPAIVLGDGPQLRQAGVEVVNLARDGFAVRVHPELVLIAGHDEPGTKGQILFQTHGKSSRDRALTNDAAWDFERGTLNGVYQFLERCGCRWFLPGPKGEVVPETPALGVACYELTAEPAFALRVFGQTHWRRAAQRHVPIQDLLSKEIAQLKMNALANRWWLVRNRASSEWFAFNHRPPRTRWEDRFGASNPEFFAVLPDGTRDLGGNTSRRHTGHLCYSERGVFRETVADVEAYFAGKTAGDRGIPEKYWTSGGANQGWAANACYGDTVSMLPHDGFRGCRCDMCMAKTATKGTRWEKHSNLVWPFVAQVAGKVGASYPEKLIICLAYSSYSVVPDGLDLPNNVIVGVCPYRLNKIYNIVDKASYTELFGLVEQLSHANDMPLLFWFHHLYRLGMRQASSYGVPMLLPHFFKQFIPDLAKYGRLFFCEMDHDSIMLEHLNRYVVMRLLFSPEADVDAILADYATAFYGPAAPHIAPLLETIERNSVKIAATGADRHEIWKQIYNEETMASFAAAGRKAAAAAEGTAHSNAVQLFNTFVIGHLKAGRYRYVGQFNDKEKQRVATLSVPRAAAVPVLDGKLNEPCWETAATRPLVTNIDGKPTTWLTTAKVTRTDDRIYCAFVCTDPRLQQNGQREMILKEDYVEVFFDQNPADDVFHQVLIYPAGRVLDFSCNRRTRKNDSNWSSKAGFGISVDGECWTIEIAVPIAAVGGGGAALKGQVWGANFCRTILNPPVSNDKFSSSSPFMMGSFRQPDLFSKLVFE